MRPYFNKLTDKYIPYLFNMMFIIIARQLNAFNVMKKKNISAISEQNNSDYILIYKI